MKTMTSRFLLSCVLVLGPVPGVYSQSFTFTTLAGAASQGSADGTGVGARFSTAQGVAVDANGNVYVGDSGNDTIRQITPAGVVTTLAGMVGVQGSADGAGTNASFDLPRSLAVDSLGNIYVADTFNSTIRKISFNGTNWMVTTMAGQAGVEGNIDATGTNAQFCTPGGVAVDPSGNVYVADQCNDTIRKITPAGMVTTLAGLAGHPGSADGTNTNARFYFPDGIAVDDATNLYVSDSVNNTIRKMTPVGTNWVVSTLAGQTNNFGSLDGTGTNALFWAPSSVAVDRQGNVYVSDTDNHTIRKITTNAVVSTWAGHAGIAGSTDATGTNALFHYPAGVSVDNAGTAYVADTDNNVIRKITTNDVVSTLAGVAEGSADGAGANARFWRPAGAAVDKSGNVFVADYYNCTVREIGTNSAVSTIAGQAGIIGSADGTNGTALFYYPFDVAVDSQGNLFVTDSGNSTIRKLSPDGTGTNWVVRTIAGQAVATGSTDATGTNALFWGPSGITIDTGGNLFVSDTGNHTIRKLTLSGTNWVTSTIAGMAGVGYGYSDGTNSGARFSYPHGVATDGAGYVYVADTENDVVRKITPVGTNWVVTTIAGLADVQGSTDAAGTNALFYFPEGIAVATNGDIYVGDTFNDTIRKLTRVGTNWVVSTVGGVAGIPGSADGNGTNALFYMPQCVVLDGAGNLYAVDTYNNTIRVGRLTFPTLQIALSGNQVILSWAVADAGFQLETSGEVSAGAVWTPLTNGVVTVGSEYVLTNAAAAATAFYRLRKP